MFVSLKRQFMSMIIDSEQICYGVIPTIQRTIFLLRLRLRMNVLKKRRSPINESSNLKLILKKMWKILWPVTFRRVTL